MKIISPFQDFYDGVKWAGQDTHVLYKRVPRTEKLGQNLVLPQSLKSYRDDARDVLRPFHGNFFVNVVCGRAYCRVVAGNAQTCQYYYRERIDWENYGDFLDVFRYKKILAVHQSPSTHMLDVLVKNLERYSRTGSFEDRRVRKTLERRMEALTKESARLDEKILAMQGLEVGDTLHLATRSPVLTLLNYDLCVVNSSLQCMGMIDLDGSLMYQNVETYLGNVLTQLDQMPITTGTDEVLAQQKGFDKHSFRQNAPGNKKLQRAQNRLRKRGIIT